MTRERRIANFSALKDHAWLKKSYGRLNKQDIVICIEFLNANGNLGKGEFELAVNRMFLDKADKPKNFPIIQELLTCANSAL